MVAAHDRHRDRATATPDRELHGSGEASALLGEIGARLADLREEFLKYVAIRIERLKLSLWESVAVLAGVALLLMGAIAVLVTAVVLCFSGLAGWIGEATAHPWLGSLLAGGVGLLLVGVAYVVARRIVGRNAAARTAERCDD